MAKNKLEKELVVNDAPLNENLANGAANGSAKSKKTDNKDKKPGFFSKIGKVFKEMFSELKKVSWPAWKVAAASLLTVLVVVLVFLVIVMGFDYLASWLLSLLTKASA
ncbi:MAG: preprotein translocase subunit SecE [Clostridia bacterium]|nr:preprotein translocase subunit SecE [Clostridia bacterium]